MLRQLAHALVGAHGGRTQGAVGIVIRELLAAHQNALGPVHGLALLKARAQVFKGLSLRLGVLKARLGQVDQRAQAVRTIALHHIHMHAAFGRLGHVAGIGGIGQYDQRARRDLPGHLQGSKPSGCRQGQITNHHFWCMQHHALHQLAAIFHRSQHRNTCRRQVCGQVGGRHRAGRTQQGGGHKNRGFARGKEGASPTGLRTSRARAAV